MAANPPPPPVDLDLLLVVVSETWVSPQSSRGRLLTRLSQHLDTARQHRGLRRTSIRLHLDIRRRNPRDMEEHSVEWCEGPMDWCKHPSAPSAPIVGH